MTDQENDLSAARLPAPLPSPLPWYARPAARAWTCAAPSPDARAFHASLPRYASTTLHELPLLAAELTVARVFVKDESSRFGLPAFKALGASWAIDRILARDAHRAPGPGGARTLRFVTATDGNHGRAVARMARQLGRRAHVFVPDGVHPAAVAAIEGEGAEVTAVAGSYDAAVRDARAAAAAPDAVLVQDMAWDGYEEIPALVVEGYATLFAEVDAQLEAAGAESPALVAVPVGVGSFAQAAVTHYRSRATVGLRSGATAGLRSGRGMETALLAVEPVGAACVLASLRAGRFTRVPAGVTAMAGLNCGTPSSLAWPVLRDGLDAAVAVTDAESMSAVRDLAELGVSAGPCGAASLAGVRAALTGTGGAERRAALGVGSDATVVLISTEGAAANPGL
ncbi:PLP-dependent lyase/thiolase [Streptomyces venezuelae]|uniref:PLP-dependent lyase/thiolase n=1 Tax=Streptomyces venezuelae TaxID=54571 RepID=A0A5P2C8Y4_STRVZ|nr:pyridoxal-phosphate dependent enzyme [Streptomyces venezuelae]QES38388.1 PLP-dependent lyase/thiolase [Streptomyces venezuelae]